MVPLNRDKRYIDIFERWRLPVVLCGGTAPSAINHSFLPIGALRKRHIAIHGIAFIGERNAESAVCDIARVRRLGRLPWVVPLTPITLHAAFKASFLPGDFKA